MTPKFNAIFFRISAVFRYDTLVRKLVQYHSAASYRNVLDQHDAKALHALFLFASNFLTAHKIKTMFFYSIFLRIGAEEVNYYKGSNLDYKRLALIILRKRNNSIRAKSFLKYINIK